MSTIYFVLLPQVHILDFAGPAHVFYEASLLDYEYTLDYLSVSDTITSAQNLEFKNLKRFDNAEPTPGDIIFIPGISFSALEDPGFAAQKRAFYSWLKIQSIKGITLAAICTGTFLLAQSGLLANKECTTHWKVLNKLKADFPDIKLVENVIFKDDQNVITSAGVTSGIDLALSILEERHGPLLPAEVAKEMIVYLRRNGGSGQNSIYLQYRSHFNKDIHHLQDWLNHHLDKSPKVEDLAKVAHMSERNLTRVFKKLTGITLQEYTMQLRTEKAKTLLSNPDLSIGQIAAKCGFRSERQLRRVWDKQGHLTLGKFRKMA